MKTYKTLAEAREAKTPEIMTIIEIEHTADGICYICAKCTIEVLRNALTRKPMPEIVRLIAEHSVRTDQEITELEQEIADYHCRRCGEKVDKSTAYCQREWGMLGDSKVQVNAYYCDRCRDLLQAIGAGESSEMNQRKAE